MNQKAEERQQVSWRGGRREKRANLRPGPRCSSTLWIAAKIGLLNSRLSKTSSRTSLWPNWRLSTGSTETEDRGNQLLSSYLSSTSLLACVNTLLEERKLPRVANVLAHRLHEPYPDEQGENGKVEKKTARLEAYHRS